MHAWGGLLRSNHSRISKDMRIESESGSHVRNHFIVSPYDRGVLEARIREANEG